MLSYQEAWDLLPEPKHGWNVALWITMALGDAYFLSSRFIDAKASFTLAMLLGGTENPFVRLRLGESYFELGEGERAADELRRALGLEGRRIFDGQDPKYLDFINLLESPGRQS